MRAHVIYVKLEGKRKWVKMHTDKPLILKREAHEYASKLLKIAPVVAIRVR